MVNFQFIKFSLRPLRLGVLAVLSSLFSVLSACSAVNLFRLPTATRLHLRYAGQAATATSPHPPFSRTRRTTALGRWLIFGRNDDAASISPRECLRRRIWGKNIFPGFMPSVGRKLQNAEKRRGFVEFRAGPCFPVSEVAQNRPQYDPKTPA